MQIVNKKSEFLKGYAFKPEAPLLVTPRPLALLPRGDHFSQSLTYPSRGPVYTSISPVLK